MTAPEPKITQAQAEGADSMAAPLEPFPCAAGCKFALDRCGLAPQCIGGCVAAKKESKQ